MHASPRHLCPFVKPVVESAGKSDVRSESPVLPTWSCVPAFLGNSVLHSGAFAPFASLREKIIRLVPPEAGSPVLPGEVDSCFFLLRNGGQLPKFRRMSAAPPQEYQVIARKYRPQTFAQVVGQDHIIRALKNAISMGRLAHAYIFVGPRGIGKTTTARIVAMALNCPGGPSAEFDPNDPVCREIAEGRSLDVREIDGASNNSVEQVRELRDDVKYLPQSGRYKIYIIDEVHMLSGAAFNALLKTLEEPPPHVKFIFATTDVHKVLPTILSRCQRFDLRRIPNELIVKQLGWIAEQEGVTIEPGALEVLARFADGGLRDAESSLDQLIAFCGKRITEDDVVEIFGLPAQRVVTSMTDALLAGDAAAAWTRVAELEEQGKDLARLLTDVLGHLRSLLVFQRAPNALARECGPEQRAAFERQKSVLPPGKLLRMVEQLSVFEGRIRHSLAPKAQLEVALAQACEIPGEVEIDDVLAAVKGGALPASPAPAVAAPAPVRPAPSVSAPPAVAVPLETAADQALAALPPLLKSGLHTEVRGGSVVVSAKRSSLAMFRGAGEEQFRARLQELTGARVVVELVEEGGEPVTRKAAPAAVVEPPAEPLRMSDDDFKNDPFIRSAIERFAARVTQLPKGTTT